MKTFEAFESGNSTAPLDNRKMTAHEGLDTLDVFPISLFKITQGANQAPSKIHVTNSTCAIVRDGETEPLETLVQQSLQTRQVREELRNQLGPLGQKYINMLFGGDREKVIDHVYGVYLSENGTMLGDKWFDIDMNDFVIHMRAMTLNDNKVDYVHWDDPNEIVDRFRLLEASRQAGHNAHNNEILSIIEELREAGLIIN
ncbi:hypothetical protein ALC60_08208 [Trachymyrmex zeteki]|uniref:Uncharacterized protein n=1 Tax=Mycetomoellerius zeteki TaxID=64791 RepID=A0A151WXX3_9HYME|nr:hypothetical protein ALC60_08208 [Trachymyrmex zeteki]